MKLVHVVGARPNFMKLAPVHRALAGRAQQKIVHTGQHYDANMSDVFFRQLEVPEADVNLGIGSASATQQTAAVMTGLEPELIADRPDWVVVYGDVNSCLAAALTAVRLGIRVAHVESGLRSFDRGMPEEINRILTDRLSDLLFVPSEDGMTNLRAEGIDPAKAHLVGNVMIDTLVRLLPAAEETIRVSPQAAWIGKPYALATLHRPSNVDDPARLQSIVDALGGISERLPILLPVHPRTRARMSDLGFTPDAERFVLAEPLGYLDFLALQKHATVVISDSGGVQEETTYLGVPCLTIRRNTERPVTVTLGTNKLVGDDPADLAAEVDAILRGEAKRGGIPPLWDGRAAERIATIICENGPQ